MASVNNNLKEGINMFFIYQLKKEARDLLFLSMKQLEKTGKGFSIKTQRFRKGLKVILYLFQMWSLSD